jgi:hypothetical protein
MGDIQKIKDEFSELCFSLDHDNIVQMSNDSSDIYLHNVIVGIENECFGFRLSDNPDRFEYQIFYVNGEHNLRGFLLQMTLDNPNRDNLVFMFSNHLTQEFPDLDAIDAFNTFQQQTRSALEKENYFTMTSSQMEKFEGKNPSFSIKGKRFEVITLIDKVKALREYFGDRHTIELEESENYVYLMLNKRNGFIKIGTSIRPKFRERTLQSQEPEIFLLSIWAAPKAIEKELHKTFLDKRKRGEWFKLQSIDMKTIKDRMAEFT